MREQQILRRSPVVPLQFVEPDISDNELLAFALGFAGTGQVARLAEQLIAEFGDVEIILASPPAALRTRGGLSDRAVAVIKLLNAFRVDNRRGRLLN